MAAIKQVKINKHRKAVARLKPATRRLNPKAETRNPKEARSSKSEDQPGSRAVVTFGASIFGFLSDLGLRLSGFY
jgi:hypothetical protein